MGGWPAQQPRVRQRPSLEGIRERNVSGDPGGGQGGLRREGLKARTAEASHGPPAALSQAG